MLKIGITGGIGVGKTYVSNIIEKMGYPVFYADQTAKDLVKNDVIISFDPKNNYNEVTTKVIGLVKINYKYQKQLIKFIKTNLEIYNVGTGLGISVLGLVEGFKTYNNCELDYEFGPKRDGDIAISVCDPTKILCETTWEPEHSDIETIVTSAWKYIKQQL